MEEAVNNALKRAGKTIQNLSWFQIVETRGSIEKNQVHHWQVTIKVGFAVT
jgi:flavin-binding protein dodecin